MRRRVAIIAAAVLGVATAAALSVTPGSASDLTPPIRGAFYYQWFPENFHATDRYPPDLGQYDSGNRAVVASHVAMMRHAGLQAAITSWWGQGQKGEQTRFPVLLDAAAAQGLQVAPYYEKEGGTTDPTVPEIQADLTYLKVYRDAHPSSFLTVGGKPVVFVYNASGSGCGDVTRWKDATNGFADWYVSMKVFTGYASCADQPSTWHQYGPDKARSQHGSYHVTVSPGFWHYNEAAPRLARDLDRFKCDISYQADAAVQWKLITSWNEIGEGTNVEPSAVFQSPSGMGGYVDALHAVYVDGQRFPCGTPTPTPTPTPTETPTPTPTPTTTPTPGDVTIAAAGDIACDPTSSSFNGGNGTASSCRQKYTGDVIRTIAPEAALTLGDTQYECGGLGAFEQSYDAAWGSFKQATKPSIGNHEYIATGKGCDTTGQGAGWKQYFGLTNTYYAFDLSNGWRGIAVDSNCSKVGGCSASSAQHMWLKAELAAHDGKPVFVYWHHPRWSSGQHGAQTSMAPIWDALVDDKDVQFVMVGHDHDYERFARMGKTGPDPAGLRQFVVGTGGRNHYCSVFTNQPGTEAFKCDVFGVLKATLHGDGSYDWQFVPEAGKTYTDVGTEGRR